MCAKREGWNDEASDDVCLLEQQQLNNIPIKGAYIHQETVSNSIIV